MNDDSDRVARYCCISSSDEMAGTLKNQEDQELELSIGAATGDLVFFSLFPRKTGQIQQCYTERAAPQINR